MEKKESFDLIQYLVSKLSDVGKVKIQKVVYFVQEVCGVDFGYDFIMHYYGPYSAELNNTLHEMKNEDILHLSLVIYSSYFGWNITLGEKANENVEPPPSIRDKTNAIVNLLNQQDATMMELSSSVHFVRAILMKRNSPFDKETVVNEVQKLKPKFGLEEIHEAYHKLQNNGLLEAVC